MLHTHNFTPRHENPSGKFADSATIISWISNNDESSYLETMNSPAEWCAEVSLLLRLSRANP